MLGRRSRGERIEFGCRQGFRGLMLSLPDGKARHRVAAAKPTSRSLVPIVGMLLFLDRRYYLRPELILDTIYPPFYAVSRGLARRERARPSTTRTSHPRIRACVSSGD